MSLCTWTGLAMLSIGVVACVLGAFGVLMWFAAHEDADAHTTPTEWPSRRGRPWDAP